MTARTRRRDHRSPGAYLLAMLRVVRRDAQALLYPWGPTARRHAGECVAWPEHQAQTWRDADADLALLVDNATRARRFVAERLRDLVCATCRADLPAERVVAGERHCAACASGALASKLASNSASNSAAGDEHDDDRDGDA